MTDPVVSVLMSVFNGETYLSLAIDSILNQTFHDFEFIIINDGSTDGTVQILNAYQDSRIKVFSQQNIGLAGSLNKAMGLAQGKYLARMDADDISLPERFQMQVNFLDEHPPVGVVGTGAIFRDEINRVQWEPPTITKHDDMVVQFLKGSPLIHPSVMMRKAVVERVGGYDVRYPFSQDYALWITLAQQTDLANLPDVLLIHREHHNSVSTARQASLKKIMLSIWIGMKHRVRAYIAFDYPPWHVCYIFSPIVYTFMEVNPKWGAFLKHILGIESQKNVTPL